MKESITLFFLIVAYNFLLYFFSKEYSLPFFPKDKWGYIILLSYNSALYLSWIFGERKTTVGWIAYLFVVQLAFFSIFTENFSIFINTLPSLVLTLSIIWIFESPTEKRIKKLIEEKARIEEEFLKNQEEIKRLTDVISTKEEFITLLLQEKEKLSSELKHLEKESKEKEKLEKNYAELLKKIKESEEKLKDYKSRLDALVEANKKLFSMIESFKESYTSKDTSELSKLRKERKKLLKEIADFQELIGDLYKKKEIFEEENKELKKQLEEKERELELLKIKLEELEKQVSSKVDYYKEILDLIFENIEFDKHFVEEFIRLSFDKKKEFIKELILLNEKSPIDSMQTVKGLDNVFKLKPKGGRIYFTYGTVKKWRIIGSINTEDDKEKARYIQEKLYRKLI